MRISPQRHTLAVLRTVIGFTQKEMAQILDCSTPTVQAVELGKLKLSMDLAQRVHFQTGISPDWLLADDITQPPVSSHGKPYTKALFEQRQSNLLSPKKKTSFGAVAELWRNWEMFIKHVKLVCILHAEAYKRGKVPIVFYKSIMSNKEILEQEIGEHAHIAEKLKALPYSDLGPIYLSELTDTLAEFEAETYAELERQLKQAKEPLPAGLRKFLPRYGKRGSRAAKKQ